MTTICLIPGDGVGQEVIPAAARVLAAVAPDLVFVEAEAGWGCFERHGTALPEATLAAVAAADGTLFGATQSPTTPSPPPPPPGGGGERLYLGYRSPILALRKHFDLLRKFAARLTNAPLANVPGTLSHGLTDLERPDHLQDGLEVPGTGIDMLIVRENTEGLYAGRERREGDTAIAERVITRHASERIARVAFEQARQRAQRRPPSLTIRQFTIHNSQFLCYHRPQSKCAQAHRRAVSRSVSRRRERVPGRDRE